MRILEKNSSNISFIYLRYHLFYIILVLILASCNPTKYVPEGESILEQNYININKEGIKKSDLLPYIKQKPNKRIFGTRFYLDLYNLSDINKEKWPHGWLRKIGEEPVIFDSYVTTKTKQDIKSYVASKGYFDATVNETVETSNKQSRVYYNVNLLPPYTIRNLHYEIADSNIKKLFYFDSVDCVITRGKPYDVDVLQAERARFERYIKEHGFYGFSGDHIYFRVDSTVGKRQVDIYYGIRNSAKIDAANRITYGPHQIYEVKNVYIYPDFIPRDALEKGEEYYKDMDTIQYRGYNFITSKSKPEIKYDLIIQALYLKPGTTYNMTNSEQTKSHLLSLKAYRLVNISYFDSRGAVADLPPDQPLMLDCDIQLTPLTPQSYKVELEGTNSSGAFGGAVNLIYQHKNIFHGAELFSMKLKGAYEGINQKNAAYKSTTELGYEASLRLPKFLLPFLEKEEFIKKYNPSTTILTAYNYQEMPLYTRTMATASFGYNWKAGNFHEHFLNPLSLNVVKLPPGSIDPAFQAKIESSSYLAYSYKDVMILGGNYSYIFNNQSIKNSRDFLFIRFNGETAGNLLTAVKKLTNAPKVDSSYQMFGQSYAQYIRTDIDFRYNYSMNEVSSVVYRAFVGIGIPYGNSKAIPFEKQYFGGGANGIRAWQVRTLGPGSYNPYKLDSTEFQNQTADIKIEANAEYRFKLFWILEGALFLEAGNIWTYKYDSSRPGSQFTFNKFYKDIAVGTGVGFRFDMKFVIGRIDVGMKLRDPSLAGGSKWIFMNRPYSLHHVPSDFAVVFGIGYPF